ncbi:MAG: 50S ribosomal protein L10 [Candidatus Lokiarchaeota archaeon]|nr:50S ribosomal protein L10 [Candidatus Lokiarchaeota archaeon]
MIKRTEIPQWKIDEVQKLVDLYKQYKTIAIVKIAGINDKQIQDVRKKLRGKAVIKMSKKSLQTRAIEIFKQESKKTNLDEIIKNIPPQSSVVYTNMDIFDLKRVFIQNKWMVPAKPDEITPVDIWVPEGDTGLPTGQVISELNMTLKLPTRIQNDTIWIRENTRTHKAGDLVTIKQASVLKKLGVNPLESLINIHFAWSDGEVIPEEVLYLDIVAFQKDVLSAYMNARTIALELGVVDDDTLEPLIQRAHKGAIALLFELPIFEESMLEDYICKAETNANVLHANIFGSAVSATSASSTSQEESKSEDPEKDDNEESVGIGGLFG